MSKKQDKSEPWKLEGPLTLYTVEALRPQMSQKLTGQTDVLWDLGSVDSCDCAGLQLLCSARKSAAAAGVTLQIENLSPAIAAAAAGIGLDLHEITQSSTPV